METLLSLLPAGMPQIVGIVLVLAIAWIVIRILLKLAVRVLVMGCFVIVVLGVVLALSGVFR
ncbi:MAG: hypothetical protein M1281_17250 [Chloroflexi bacterium]|nr:hypothetical protein [Chloroflexota bacterium]